MTSQNYTLNVIKNEWVSLNETFFRHATNGEPALQETQVGLMFDDNYFHIRFKAFQNPFLHQNTYQNHNDPLYNQEVFEVFIAPNDETPENYCEIEINPNNKLWIGKIYNPIKDMGGNTISAMVDYEQSGIKHSVETAKDTWEGSLSIPYNLIGKAPVYRLNFYRIVAICSHSEPNWECTAETCNFLCWSPTMSGSQPAFHRPEYFGKVQINQSL